MTPEIIVGVPLVAGAICLAAVLWSLSRRETPCDRHHDDWLYESENGLV